MIFITSPRLRKSSKDKKIAREKSSLHPTHSPTNKQKKEKSGMCSLSTCLDFSFGSMPSRQGASSPSRAIR